MNNSARIMTELMAVIEDRKANPPPRSYTAQLFTGGVETIGAKLLEEADEVRDAARQVGGEAGRAHLRHEAADVIYHLFVMMAHCGLTLEEVCEELAGRFGTSGLDEKAARQQRPDTAH